MDIGTVILGVVIIVFAFVTVIGVASMKYDSEHLKSENEKLKKELEKAKKKKTYYNKKIKEDK